MVFTIKRELAEKLNNKRLIYVKNIYG